MSFVKYHYAECHDDKSHCVRHFNALSVIKLSVMVLSVTKLNVIMLGVTMLNVVMPNFSLLNVIMLSVTKLSIAMLGVNYAKSRNAEFHRDEGHSAECNYAE